MPRSVTVLASSLMVGSGVVVPYSHGRGRVNSIRYRVPLYRMNLSGLDSAGNGQVLEFSVIRFGVVDTDGTHHVVGLADRQEHVLRWVSYMGGSWQIYGNFLIHDGADDPAQMAYGAIGCIEVTGVNAWPRFLESIRMLAGLRDEQQISRSGCLRIKIEGTTRPPLVRVNP